jgi:hypothetical protein
MAGPRARFARGRKIERFRVESSFGRSVRSGQRGLRSEPVYRTARVRRGCRVHEGRARARRPDLGPVFRRCALLEVVPRCGRRKVRPSGSCAWVRLPEGAPSWKLRLGTASGGRFLLEDVPCVWPLEGRTSWETASAGPSDVVGAGSGRGRSGAAHGSDEGVGYTRGKL